MTTKNYTTSGVHGKFAMVGEIPDVRRRVRLVGRLQNRRAVGPRGFCHLSDEGGILQVYVHRKYVGTKAYTMFRAAELGCTVRIEGVVYRTKKQRRLTVRADEFTIVEDTDELSAS